MSDETYKPGDSCGPYRIDGFLEAGGFAEVYSATNLLTGRRAALKVLQADRMRIEEVLQRFKHEIQLLATLEHVNVVGFYEAGMHASRIYAAMELLEGRTLRVHLHERGALDVEEALSILYEIACGVAAAQEIGVVHRDIKPENVFLTISRVAKVLDFGIAKFEGWGFQSTGRERRGMLGTPSYMSPEQIEGVPPTFASDVYQAGLVAHEMLTGRHAWSYQNGELPTQMQLCELQVNAMPRALVGIRKDVRALIEKALKKRPEDRFADMDQLAAATWEVMETIRLERSGPDQPEDRRNPAAADGSPLGPLARRAFQPAHTPAHETPPLLPASKVEVRPTDVQPPAEVPEFLDYIVPPGTPQHRPPPSSTMPTLISTPARSRTVEGEGEPEPYGAPQWLVMMMITSAVASVTIAGYYLLRRDGGEAATVAVTATATVTPATATAMLTAVTPTPPTSATPAATATATASATAPKAAPAQAPRALTAAPTPAVSASASAAPAVTASESAAPAVTPSPSASAPQRNPHRLMDVEE